MVKRILNLYVEAEDVELALARNINLSAFFRECLSIEVLKRNVSQEELSKEDKLRLSENKLALLTAEMKRLREENEALKKEKQKKKEERVYLTPKY